MTVGGHQGIGARHESLTALRELLIALEADVGEHYVEHGAGAVRPRFTAAMLVLSALGSMTVRELAQQVGVTHSAMSQTVAHLRREGMVSSTAGVDARTQVVILSGRGRELVPFLDRAQHAGADAWKDLETELDYPIERVVADLRAALARRSFLQRLRHHWQGAEAEGASAEPTG